MLCVKRDALGRIAVAAEARLVNERGELDVQGSYCWIEQMEVSVGVGIWEAARAVMAYYAHWMPTAMFGYWIRRDKDKPKVHCYSRRQIEQMVAKEVGENVAVG